MTPARLAMALAALLLTAVPVRAGNEVALYLGVSATPKSDLHVTGAGDDVTYHGVSWHARSFENPLYYGIRLTHWRAGDPDTGLALDFTHAKIYLKDTAVRVTGSRGGTSVDAVEPTSASITSFSNSHGLNLLTLNALVRGDGRIRPYAGVGAGIALPHVEAEIGGTRVSEYQYGGPAVQGLLGVSAYFGDRFGDRWGVFGEAKLDRAWLHEDLHGGRSADLNVNVQQLVGGVSRGF
jgi:lipid A oxidase